MGISLNRKDVKVAAGIAAIVAGLMIVVSGVLYRDVALITLGAGMLGAPGIATSAYRMDEDAGTTTEGETNDSNTD